MQNPPLPEYITRPQLCERLQISDKHLRNLEARGTLKPIRLGRSVRFNIGQVSAALQPKEAA